MEKKTPLYERHVSMQGRIVPFAGYLLPVQYSAGLVPEHLAVRTKAGLFDVSHMGEILITGKDALKNVNRIFTNDFSGMYDGQVRYSPMCNDNGCVLDDMIIMKYTDEKYLAVVNASNREKDAEWIGKNITGDTEMKDISDDYAQVALQGPASENILMKITAKDNIPVKYYTFIADVPVAGVNCTISRTGYTGEHGYEILCAPADAEKLWDALLEAGKPDGLIPCGLGARDTLRLEAGMPLYGHEMDETVSPLEAGLSFAVKMTKDDFIGKKALEKPVARKRIGIKVTSRGIVRENSNVFSEGLLIGKTTSGTLLPYCDYAGAMALINASADVKTGTAVSVDVRGRILDAEVITLPFYKKA